MASYALNERAVGRARALIESRQYVLDSDWGDVQPKAADENAGPLDPESMYGCLETRGQI
jgi:hypothetical protein